MSVERSLVRISCRACDLSPIWTDQAKALLKAICRERGACRAECRTEDAPAAPDEPRAEGRRAAGG